jgi:hypothetical protein
VAMIPQLWSQSALAVEFNLDRRTVARCLRRIPPGGKIKGGHDGWLLADVAPVLLGATPASASDEVDMGEVFAKLGAPFSTSENAVDEALCTLLQVMVSQIPWHATMAAIYRAGASLSVAHAFYRAMCSEMFVLCDDLSEGWGVVWRHKDHYPEPFEPDWKAIAAQLGERVDRAAWRRHEAAMGKRFNAIVKGAK